MELKRRIKYAVTLTAFLYMRMAASAQDVTVRGGFLEDSLRVGEEITFYLSARYPSTLDVIFPDSTFNFSPFEIRKKEYFPTHTTGGKSYDSVVYYLTTFEVDSIQSLHLPVYQLNAQDCTQHQSNSDNILLSQVIKKLPDSLLTADLPLQATVAYQSVSYDLNYQLFIIILMVVLIIAAVLWFIFGKQIRKDMRLKRMRKAHQHFLEVYSKQQESVKKAFSTQTTEGALLVWKKYMEQLNAKPYTKLTTPETISLEKDETLGKNLHALDGAIYGYNTNVIDPLENLKVFADRRFSQKVEEVKHG